VLADHLARVLVLPFVCGQGHEVVRRFSTRPAFEALRYPLRGQRRAVEHQRRRIKQPIRETLPVSRGMLEGALCTHGRSLNLTAMSKRFDSASCPRHGMSRFQLSRFRSHDTARRPTTGRRTAPSAPPPGTLAVSTNNRWTEADTVLRSTGRIPEPRRLSRRPCARRSGRRAGRRRRITRRHGRAAVSSLISNSSKKRGTP
jgi:hypothetical protein